MKILWKGFCSKNHSWSHCAQNICRKFKDYGHQVDMFSTNGLEFFPDDLRDNLIGFAEEGSASQREQNQTVSNEYDLAISYTAMIHWVNI